MFKQSFGQYLLNKGLITPEQLKDAFDYEHSSHVKLGVLAINSGFMTAAQVEEVHELQKRLDKRFGEIAINKGYLDMNQLEDLLQAQKQRHLSLSQVIIDRGYFTLSELEKALENFKNDSGFTSEQIQVLQQADFDQIVRMLLNFSVAGATKDIYFDYVSLFLRNIVRFLNEEPTITKTIVNPDSFHGWVVLQNIIGEFNLCTGISAREDVLLEIGRRFSGETLTSFDDFAKDCAAEFLNVHNGLFNVNMSNDRMELGLSPQTIEMSPQIPGNKIYHIPITLSFGQFTLILSQKD